jgi:quinol monooxygenase YgiN
MPKLVEMDEFVTLREQMEQRIGPVILVNRLTVRPAEADQLLGAWAADAEVMKRQPGFISTQLHRGVGGSGQFLNVAVWDSVEDFRRAFSNPEFPSPPDELSAEHDRLGTPVPEGRRARNLCGLAASSSCLPAVERGPKGSRPTISGFSGQRKQTVDDPDVPSEGVDRGGEAGGVPGERSREAGLRPADLQPVRVGVFDTVHHVGDRGHRDEPAATSVRLDPDDTEPRRGADGVVGIGDVGGERARAAQ